MVSSSTFVIRSVAAFGMSAGAEDGLRPSAVEHPAPLMRPELSRDLAPFAAGDVDEGGDEDDGEAAKDVDQAALDVVAKVLFRLVRRPRPDLEEGPVGVVVVQRVRVVVDHDRSSLSPDHAVRLSPLVAPVGRQVPFQRHLVDHRRRLHPPPRSLALVGFYSTCCGGRGGGGSLGE